MHANDLLLLLLAFAAAAFYVGRGRANHIAKLAGGSRQLHSLPDYHGHYTALCCGLPAVLLLILWIIFSGHVISAMVLDSLPAGQFLGDPGGRELLANKIANIAQGVLPKANQPAILVAAAEELNRLTQISRWSVTALASCVSLVGLIWARSRIAPELRSRPRVEASIKYALFFCACVAVFTTFGIIFSVLFESLQFFQSVPVVDFIFGLEWSPQTAIRDDQVGSSGSFGAVPLFVGTLLVSAVAMVVAVPIGLMSAIFLAEYAHKSVRAYAKPALEVLAGIPTVVYGFFAALTVAPFLRDFGQGYGFSVSSESALAAGLVMGVMIIPFISSLSDDVITAVPQSLRDGSLAMGATHSETVIRVVIPAALPGIVAGIMLAISRAIGETMIVVMASGLAANMTFNPLDSVTTVTVQIVTLLTGDQEFDSPKTLAAFALGLVLFLITLILNIIALKVVKRFREQYE